MALLEWLIIGAAAFGGLVRADVCGAAVADVFPGATAYTARYGRPPGSPGGRARYQGRRKGDRLARTAERRKTGRAVFPRQWWRFAQSCCSLSCAHCRWERTHRAQLSRIWRFDRKPD